EIGQKIVGAGAYSDRLFFEVEAENETAVQGYVQAAMNKALEILRGDMKSAEQKKGFNEEGCLEFLKKYVYQLSVVEEKKDGKTIPMHEMTAKLDLLETYAPYQDEEKPGESDYLLRYLASDALKGSGWVQAHKVTSRDLKQLAEAGKEKVEHQWQRYVAVVYADGDKMGSLLSKFSEAGNEAAIRSVSQFLLERAKWNVNTVKAYGGMPIYFGGDDMFFIAPLYGMYKEDGQEKEQEISIFRLIEKLSAGFDGAYQSIRETLEKWEMKKQGNARNGKLLDALKDCKPSLSFGVSVCYHKYPLQMIMDMARDALFGEAKYAQWSGGRSKKAVQVHLRKHSGQESGILLSCWNDDGEESTYTRFNKLIEKNADSLVLHALHWKIVEQFDLIACILFETEGEERTWRLREWFRNNFNEWIEDETGKPAPAEENAQGEKKNPKEDFLEGMNKFLCLYADQLPKITEPSGEEKEKKTEEELKEEREEAEKKRKNAMRKAVDGMFRMDEFLHTPVKHIKPSDQKAKEGKA
ncbi:MAG: hypothetical protein IJD60_12320, partial [Clostridia bacterium]|nr:hypothetical protein [Clostridia bacterium]